MIGGVDVKRIFGHDGGLAKCAGSDQAFEHLLDIPAVAHEFAGEPIEQLRVGGGAALQAKILACFHDAAAKNQLPPVIDDGPGSQRVPGIDDPARQAEPVLRVGGIQGDVEKARHAGAYLIATLFVIAADEDISLRGFFVVAHDHRGDLLCRLARALCQVMLTVGSALPYLSTLPSIFLLKKA